MARRRRAASQAARPQADSGSDYPGPATCCRNLVTVIPHCMHQIQIADRFYFARSLHNSKQIMMRPSYSYWPAAFKLVISSSDSESESGHRESVTSISGSLAARARSCLCRQDSSLGLAGHATDPGRLDKNGPGRPIPSLWGGHHIIVDFYEGHKKFRICKSQWLNYVAVFGFYFLVGKQWVLAGEL